MNVWRTIVLAVLILVCAGAAAPSDKDRKGPKIDDRLFRQVCGLLLNDPLSRSSGSWARLIMLYVMGEPANADIAIGSDELSWTGFGKEQNRCLLLLAAYAAGNGQSQLNSGVKRNDRYSGLLTLFRVYRVLQEKDDKFKIDEVEELLARHRDGKLTAYLQKLDEKKPEKWKPSQQTAIRKLMDQR